VRHWVVQDIGVPVELLRIHRVGYNRIRAGKTADARHVETGIHIN
jgi:hypothetical protein